MDNRLIFLYFSVGVMEGRSTLGRLPDGSGSPSAKGGRRGKSAGLIPETLRDAALYEQSGSADAMLPRKASKL